MLAAWSGLGYNRRALALQAAARVVAERRLAATDLTELPGVGPYTAAAVGVVRVGPQVAAIDTNVRRVLERRDGSRGAARAGAARVGELLPAGARRRSTRR